MGRVPFTVNQDIKVLRPANDIDSAYAFQLLRGLEGQVVARAVKSGTTVESIDGSIFFDLMVFTPSLPEQRRIADILDALDGTISKTEQLIAKLLHHKASMLQDYEQGRPMEIAEIMLAPLAFARAAKLSTPTLDTVAAIAAKLAKDRGLVGADVRVEV